MSDKILDKVNKMLAMAASAEKIGSQAEAEAFAAQAQELLDKYNLSMTDVELHARRNEPIGFQLIPTDEKPVPFWQEVLCNGIATINGCFQVSSTKDGVLAISGRAEDRSITIHFFKHFVATGRTLGKEFDQAYTSTLEFFQSGHAGLPMARESYLFGYAVGVTRKLAQTYHVDRKQAKQSEALVWLDGRHGESKKWMTENLKVEIVEDEDAIPSMDRDYVNMGMEDAAGVAFTDKILA